MVQIAHTTPKTLHFYAALRQVPAISERGEAQGAFEFLYTCPNGADVFGYYKPESLHTHADTPDYQVTVNNGRADDCDCPDSVYRGHDCKHMAEYNSRRRAAEAMAAEVVPPVKSDERKFTAAQVAELLKDWN